MSAKESLATQVSNYAATDDPIDRALHTDPIAAAEVVTGKSYKEDKATEGLGFAMFFEHNRAKEKLLQEAGDTWFNGSFKQHLDVALDLGFEIVAVRPVEYDEYREDPVTLYHVTLVHPDGALLIVESYAWGSDREQTVNTSQLYVNWKENDEARAMAEAGWAYHGRLREIGKLIKSGEATQDDLDEKARLEENPPPMAPQHTLGYSGGYEYPEDIPLSIENPDFDPENPYDYENNPRHIDNPAIDKTRFVLCAHFDTREGLKHLFNKLQRWGTFVTPWVKVPFGIDLMDLNESKDRYYHSMWPPRSEYDERVEGESDQPKGLQTAWGFNEKAFAIEVQFESIAHEVVSEMLEEDDRNRWPDEVTALIGDDAIEREIKRDDERFKKDCERFGFDPVDVLKRAQEIYEAGTPKRLGRR